VKLEVVSALLVSQEHVDKAFYSVFADNNNDHSPGVIQGRSIIKSNLHKYGGGGQVPSKE
jgi:hypothetical protein